MTKNKREVLSCLLSLSPWGQYSSPACFLLCWRTVCLLPNIRRISSSCSGSDFENCLRLRWSLQCRHFWDPRPRRRRRLSRFLSRKQWHPAEKKFQDISNNELALLLLLKVTVSRRRRHSLGKFISCNLFYPNMDLCQKLNLHACTYTYTKKNDFGWLTSLSNLGESKYQPKR